MKIKKYYAILQEKVKKFVDGKEVVEIKEYVHDVQGIAPVIARNEAYAVARENGMSVVGIYAYKN